MNILLLSQVPSIYEPFRQPNQPFPEFQAQTYWLKALHQLGHTVEVFKYSDTVVTPKQLAVTLDTTVLNTNRSLHQKIHLAKNRFYKFWPENILRSLKLNNLIHSYEPDVIIISGGIAHLLPDPLLTAHHQGAKIFLLHGEHPLISATHFECDNVHLFDYVITNDPTHPDGWLELGAKNSICLPYAAIDPQVHKKLKTDNRKPKFDVAFVGTLLPERQHTLEKIIKAGINLKIWGYLPTHLDPALQSHYQGEAWGSQAVHIYNQSKIVINFVPKHMPKGGNMRTFEIPGSGAFQLINRCPTTWYIPNKEIVIFNSDTDLITKINFYLQHSESRTQIAKAGYTRTHKDHTYTNRFKKILSLI